MEEEKKELNNWYKDRHREAVIGLKKLGLKLYMEIKMHPEKTLSKENEELRDVARSSTIHTFGWPIAVFLDTEHRPRPKSYGIKAEVPIKDSDALIDKRYDFWALKNDGAFYLLKSLFESLRKPNYLFFNTRIVRTTELLMYALNLYSGLGLEEDDKIYIQIEYSGLKGLNMGAVGNRLILGEYKNNSEDVVRAPKNSPINLTIKELDNRMPDFVEILITPLFEVFDWFKVEKSIIDEIVLNYREGRVT